VSCVATLTATQALHSATVPVAATAPTATSDNYQVKRFKSNYKFISPIVSIETTQESPELQSLKGRLNDYISGEKQKGLTSAAVYFREFSASNGWFAINAKEKYDPGSLLKVGVLITYMQMAEDNPKLLNMEVQYQGRKGFVLPVEHYQSDTVIEGHQYRISELLEHMIKYSDNRATLFLEDHMDTAIFKREFGDLGISEPNFQDPRFTLNVAEYSMMFRALYNAGYLRKNASENALALLSESVFNDGLKKGLPGSVVIAHKYGEFGSGDFRELHESGIIYLDKHPYLLTVMTRGTDWNELSNVIGHISKIVYEHELAASVH
jgi:beta-lactamase class A